jgi:hypothetical protein
MAASAEKPTQGLLSDRSEKSALAVRLGVTLSGNASG